MKILILFFALLFLAACGKDDVKFEVYNAEAFAFDLGDSWEINSTARVKGFEQKEDEESGMFSASVPFTVDLIKPSGEKIKKVYASVKDEVKKEEIMDIGLDAQIELDSTYNEGVYKLIYNVSDNFNDENEAVTEVTLELIK